MDFLIQYIDALWLPLVYMAARPDQRPYALGYTFCCMLMLRMLTELMEQLGFPEGFLPFLHSDVFHRGLVTYGVFQLIYLALLMLSPNAKGSLLLAGSIMIFSTASFAFCMVMVL